MTPSLLRAWPLPSAGEDKYSRGAVMVIGGARATPGAALLAGTAALRAGAGRLTMAVAESVATQLAVTLPEAGVTGLPETAQGSVLGSGLEPIFSELGSADAVLIGPGLDDIDLTEKLLRALLELDSDGVDRPRVSDRRRDHHPGRVRPGLPAPARGFAGSLAGPAHPDTEPPGGRDPAGQGD